MVTIDFRSPLVCQETQVRNQERQDIKKIPIESIVINNQSNLLIEVIFSKKNALCAHILIYLYVF